MKIDLTNVDKNKSYIAILQNRSTEKTYSLLKINKLLFLCNDSEISSISTDELLIDEKYIIAEGCIGKLVHGGSWELCHPKDDMHEIRMIKDGRILNSCGDPLARVQDYIKIRSSRDRSLSL